MRNVSAAIQQDTLSPRRGFTKPDQLSDGIDYTIVNGQIECDHGLGVCCAAAAGIRPPTENCSNGLLPRKGELLEWVEACRAFLKRRIRIFASANNHYAGHGPATVRLFLQFLEKNKV